MNINIVTLNTNSVTMNFNIEIMTLNIVTMTFNTVIMNFNIATINFNIVTMIFIPITIDLVKKAISKMKSGKDAGYKGIIGKWSFSYTVKPGKFKVLVTRSFILMYPKKNYRDVDTNINITHKNEVSLTY